MERLLEDKTKDRLKEARSLTPVRAYQSSEALKAKLRDKRSASLDQFLSAKHLDIEIGCGVGLHPLQRSMAYPDRHLIAIEHTQEKYQSFNRRFEKHGSPVNLLPVHANAITWIDSFVPVGSVDNIFLLYPNPNPKRATQRWFRMPFFSKLIEVLKDGGHITLATNVLSYGDEAEVYGLQHWGLSMVHRRSLSSADGIIGRTHFERKYLGRGEICAEIVFAKNCRQKIQSAKNILKKLDE